MVRCFLRRMTAARRWTRREASVPWFSMSDQRRILITETLDPVCADWLSQRADVQWCSHDQAEFDQLLPTADALVVRTYTQVDTTLLERAVKLKVVGRAGVGLDNIDRVECEKRGVAVVYTPDANTQAVVEYVFSLILDALRPRVDLRPTDDAVAFDQYRKTHVGRQLNELTLGVLGFGRIGKRVGEVAHAMGMHVLANDLLPEAALRKAADYPFHFVGADELFKQADVLTVHVDGRADNHHLINADVLGRLKPDCLLMNTSRGFVIDNTALADWLKANANARAVLDVHDPEPPPPAPQAYPLWDSPNARLLPHLASRTDRALKNMSWVVKDVMAVLEGESPMHPA